MTAEPTAPSDQPTASAVPLAGRSATKLSPRRPWLVGALLLAGGAQVITISALLSADPLAVTWWSLLLAIAPAPLAAVAAFAPAALARPAAVAAAVVLVAAGSCIPACSSCPPWPCWSSGAVRCCASSADPVRTAAHMRPA